MTKHLIRLHILILILAFTGLLGDLIVVDAYQLVWYRTLVGSAGLIAWLLVFNKPIKLKLRNTLIYLAIGVSIGLHWICFFHSIDISTISVGVGCLASATLFTSFIEPFLFKKKIHLHEIIIGVMVIIGLYIIFQFEVKYTLGIIYATLSAFFGALFTVLNKKYIDEDDNKISITFYEILGAFLTLAIIQVFRGEYEMYSFSLSQNDFICLLILAVVCTSWAFMEQVKLISHLSAFIIVLSFNLEPIYGILIGAAMGEDMTGGFYLGAGIIVLSIFIYPIIHRKLNLKSKKTLPSQ